METNSVVASSATATRSALLSTLSADGVRCRFAAIAEPRFDALLRRDSGASWWMYPGACCEPVGCQSSIRARAREALAWHVWERSRHA